MDYTQILTRTPTRASYRLHSDMSIASFISSVTGIQIFFPR